MPEEVVKPAVPAPAAPINVLEYGPATQARLKVYEGYKPAVYRVREQGKPPGKPTVGFGTETDNPVFHPIYKKYGVTPQQMATEGYDPKNPQMLREMARTYWNDVLAPGIRKDVPGFTEFDPKVQTALADMWYNMGGKKFRGFENMNKALQLYRTTKDPAYFRQAMKEMYDSEYYRNQPTSTQRATNNYKLMQNYFTKLRLNQMQKTQSDEKAEGTGRFITEKELRAASKRYCDENGYADADEALKDIYAKQEENFKQAAQLALTYKTSALSDESIRRIKSALIGGGVGGAAGAGIGALMGGTKGALIGGGLGLPIGAASGYGLSTIGDIVENHKTDKRFKSLRDGAKDIAADKMTDDYRKTWADLGKNYAAHKKMIADYRAMGNPIDQAKTKMLGKLRKDLIDRQTGLAKQLRDMGKPVPELGDARDSTISSRGLELIKAGDSVYDVNRRATASILPGTGGEKSPREVISEQYPSESSFRNSLADARKYRVSNQAVNPQMSLDDAYLDKKVPYVIGEPSTGEAGEYGISVSEYSVRRGLLKSLVDKPGDVTISSWNAKPHTSGHEYRHALQRAKWTDPRVLKSTSYSTPSEEQNIAERAADKYNKGHDDMRYAVGVKGEREARLGGLKALASHTGTRIRSADDAYDFLDRYTRGALDDVPAMAFAGSDAYQLKQLRDRMLKAGDVEGWEKILRAIAREMPGLVDSGRTNDNFKQAAQLALTYKTSAEPKGVLQDQHDKVLKYLRKPRDTRPTMDPAATSRYELQKRMLESGMSGNRPLGESQRERIEGYKPLVMHIRT